MGRETPLAFPLTLATSATGEVPDSVDSWFWRLGIDPALRSSDAPGRTASPFVAISVSALSSDCGFSWLTEDSSEILERAVESSCVGGVEGGI